MPMLPVRSELRLDLLKYSDPTWHYVSYLRTLKQDNNGKYNRVQPSPRWSKSLVHKGKETVAHVG